jgi:hypothetical protein
MRTGYHSAAQPAAVYTSAASRRTPTAPLTSDSTTHSALSRLTSPLQSASKRRAVTPLWLYLRWWV